MDIIAYSESFDTTYVSTDISAASTIIERRVYVPDIKEMERPRPSKPKTLKPPPMHTKDDYHRNIQCPPSLLAQIEASQLQKSLKGTVQTTSNCVQANIIAFQGGTGGDKKQVGTTTTTTTTTSSNPSMLTRLANPCNPTETAEAILASAEQGIDACMSDPQSKTNRKGTAARGRDRSGHSRGLSKPKVLEPRSSSRSRRPQTPPTCESSSMCSDEEMSSQVSYDQNSYMGHVVGVSGKVGSNRGVHLRWTPPRRMGRLPFDEPSTTPSDEDFHYSPGRFGDSYRSPPPSDCDVIFLVGDEEFVLSTTSLKLSGRSLSHLMKSGSDGTRYTVDLSGHSLEEWMVVLNFLKTFGDKRDIDWQTLPVVLPWLVDFQATPILDEVDAFLLHDVLGGGRTINDEVMVSISNLIQLTKIAYTANLESCKSQARRLLRLKLLKPSTQSQSMDRNQVPTNNMDSVGSDIELAWTLSDLQSLSSLMMSFPDLRDYLWEYAVIVYLPHDLDVSNSAQLVSNTLFPYLLREGMMQMMIVEEMESVNNSMDDQQHQQHMVGGDPKGSNNLVQKLTKADSPTNRNNSAGTTCSATTIPTKPTPTLGAQTQEEINDHLLRIESFFRKYQLEKTRQISSTPVSESSFSASSIVEPVPGSKLNRRAQQRERQRVLQTKRRGEC